MTNEAYQNSDTVCNAAVEFLAGIARGGPIAVAAIIPDGPVAGATFCTTTERAGLLAWLQAHNGQAGLYFQLNPPKPIGQQVGLRGRCREEDVAEICFVGVDIDPGKVEAEAGGYEIERRRLLGLAEEWRDHFIASATVAIHSGNGVQLIWRLANPLPTDPATVAQVKAQAKALELLLGSDKVRDLNRLYRIPGTINLPDARKRAKGRGPATSRLLHFHPESTYRLETLRIVAPPAPAETAATATSPDLDSFDYAAVIEAAEGGELPAHLELIADAVRARIEKRGAPANRSDRDFAFATECVEAGLTDPTELGQAAFSLSPGKLIEKDGQGRGDYYARHTIKNALARTRPRPETKSEAWFTSAPAAPAAPAKLPTLHAVRGVVPATGLPVREWLIRPRLPIGDVAQLVGEPGISKSTFTLRDALVVATGREDLLRGSDERGNPISPERLHRQGPVLSYNAEDRIDEMRRRLRAAQLHYGVTDADMRHPIYLWSGVDGEVLKIATRSDSRGPLRRASGAADLEQMIVDHDVVLAVLDPQISLIAGAAENSNDDMDFLFQTLAVIASRCKVSILVVHHTAKGTRQAAGDMGAGRGGFAAVGKVRSAATLTNVTGDRDDEKEWGAAKGDRLIRLDAAKTSHDSMPTEPIVFARRSAPVGNGSATPGESAAELFAGTPRERLEAEGDFAPVLEIVDLKAKAREAKAAAEGKASADAYAIAKAADELMGDSDKVKLSELRDALRAELQAERITRAKGRQQVDARRAA